MGILDDPGRPTGLRRVPGWDWRRPWKYRLDRATLFEDRKAHKPECPPEAKEEETDSLASLQREH